MYQFNKIYGKIVRHISLALIPVLGKFRVLVGDIVALVPSFPFLIPNFILRAKFWVIGFGYLPLYMGHRAPPYGLGVSACGCLFSCFICSFIVFYPSMLGIHLTITSPPRGWSCLAWLWIWIFNAWPTLLCEPWSCSMAAWESEKTVVLRAFPEIFSFKAIFKASDILHNSGSNTSLFSPSEILQTSHLWEAGVSPTTDLTYWGLSCPGCWTR